MKQNVIKKLSDREHILLRSGMYLGGIVETKKELYVIEDSKIQLKEVSYVPGLLKIIDEIIDNSVDEAIRTNFKFANKIQITIDDKHVQVYDNGRGLPQTLGHDNLPQAVIAFTEARAGSNFSDETKANGIGTNGVGSFLTNVFSTKFVVKTSDGTNELKLTSINNAESYSYDVKAGVNQGTSVTFYPDLAKFSMTSIDGIYTQLIANRLTHLAQSFPEITFTLNKKAFKALPAKKYLDMFSEGYELIQGQKYTIAVTANDYDDFKLFTYVNGLDVRSGGSHIDLITTEVVNSLRDKISKKYKGIKPGDIKNKLRVIAIFNDFPNLSFDSQTKERVTNSVKDVRDYLGDIDFEKFSQKIFKNSAIIDPITEVYKIKEELKKRQEMKGLEKVKKKIKSEKYLPSIDKRKYLILAEGDSATGGLVPVLGRKEFGYYSLKGKPLNSYAAEQSKFTQNKELTELFQIIKNEDYENIIIASDADADGAHIRFLLAGFFQRYLPEFKGNVGALLTPIMATKKNGKMINWVYNFGEKLEVKAGETQKYYKGLGSFLAEDLQQVIDKDGLAKMIEMIDFDSDEIIDDWLSNAKSDKRKEYILANDFDITKI